MYTSINIVSLCISFQWFRKTMVMAASRCVQRAFSMYVCMSPHMYGCFKNLLVQGRKWTFQVECHTYMNNAFWMPYMNNSRRKLLVRPYSCMYGIQGPKFIFLLVQGGFWNSHTYAETYIHTYLSLLISLKFIFLLVQECFLNSGGSKRHDRQRVFRCKELLNYSCMYVSYVCMYVRWRRTYIHT